MPRTLTALALPAAAQSDGLTPVAFEVTDTPGLSGEVQSLSTKQGEVVDAQIEATLVAGFASALLPIAGAAFGLSATNGVRGVAAG